jgi:hypothetical protein
MLNKKAKTTFLRRLRRDSFASLKKTALKLGVPFWNYLLDRLSHENKIPTLPNMIIQAAITH